MPAIGIDLGTTHSCVAVWQNGKVEIIHNELGSRITPSYAAFTENERLIGNAAKNQAPLNPENTVFDSKRLIGRKFNDDVVQKDMKLWPFTVVNDRGNPKIAVVYKGEKKSYAPEEISSMVLTKMKQIAEAYLKEEVSEAVITVPAYFSIHQREATRDAGKIAGLKVLGIISEPTAAAIAYGLDKCSSEKRNIMIYDLGGGTFDVSVMTIHGTSFVVKATSGDTHLGGGDFDNILIKHFCDEFQRKYKKDVTQNKFALGRLRKEAEKAKKSLSSSSTARLYIENFIESIDFQTQISRIRFDELCKDLFESTLDPVEKALKDAGLTKSEIDDVVLVGGSTRILKIQELLQNFFDGKKLTMNINADEAVAYGAAVHAATLSKSRGIPTVFLKDVTPLSLGVENLGFVFSIIVPRNTQLPFEIEKTYTTCSDYQESILVKVYEGESPISTKNNLLGKFQLCGILPALRDVPKIKVKFQLNADGLLNATAFDADTGSTNNISIKIDKGRFTEKEINRMIAQAKKFRADDVKESKRLFAFSQLESFAITAKQRVSDAGLSESEKQAIIARCKETVEWLEDNSKAEIEVYKSKLKELQEFCQPLQINFGEFNI